jgi:hypothetical protein
VYTVIANGIMKKDFYDYCNVIHMPWVYSAKNKKRTKQAAQKKTFTIYV